MVATELAEDDSQLEVRIIRTKNGIKNVAYIAENDNSLIVHQKTSSADAPNADPNFDKNNQNLQEAPGFSEITKFPFNRPNILKPFSSPTTEYPLSKFFNNRISPLTNSTVEVEVEVPKVRILDIFIKFDIIVLFCASYQRVF